MRVNQDVLWRTYANQDANLNVMDDLCYNQFCSMVDLLAGKSTWLPGKSTVERTDLPIKTGFLVASR